MKSVLKSLAVLAFVFLATISSAFALETKKDQQAAFQAILSELKIHYGMIKFKSQMFGTSYDELDAKYTRLIETATTLEEEAGLQPKQQREILPPDEFRQLMIGFAAEFKDGHTNILRQSREAWTLGIRTAAVGGRLYIVGFNPAFFNPNSTFPQLQVGDEVLEVDGRPVSQIARENALYMSLATENSRQMRALEMILNTPHRWLRARVAGAPVTVRFARAGEKKPIEGKFHWVSTKDFTELASLSRYVTPEKVPAQKEKEKLTERPYTYGEGSTVKTYFSEGLKKAGLQRGQITDFGKLLNVQITEEKAKKTAGVAHDAELAELEPIERLAAYTIRHEGKTFGVIRVPSYSPDDGFGGAINELKWLGQVIGQLEASTDALIIDQLSNGGGYVYEFAQFVRLFAHEGEIKTALMDVKLSDTFFNAHSDILDPEHDYEKPVEGRSRNFAKMILEREALKKMREAYARGEKWSGFVSFFGGSHELMPAEYGRVVALPGKVYTKPVLLLNDGRSASGGDFMPSALQAAGRAVVMGETSMGLGGPVYRGQESMPGSEVFMRCTMGYCVRADGLPIENMGVVPDVRREIVPADLKNGFADYAKDVLAAAVKLAGGAKAGAIDSELRAELVKRDAAANKEPLSDGIKALTKLVAEFKTSGYDRKAALDETTRRYRELAEKVRELAPKISAHEWKLVEFPLPEALLEGDLLLASMTDRASALNRLLELYKHPAYRSNAALHDLVAAVGTGLHSMGEGADVRINDCVRLLTRR